MFYAIFKLLKYIECSLLREGHHALDAVILDRLIRGGDSRRDELLDRAAIIFELFVDTFAHRLAHAIPGRAGGNAVLRQ